ncbi:hypothetical protein KSS87_004630 [Heliosperma pusillum]|nr:hypothetical protein KSS87_004630 [Heliosperma pusillum]
MVSQETLWNDIMKIRKFERCIAIGELGTPSSGRVAVTIKMWDSCDGNKKFLAITEFDVDDKLTAITMDNHASNDELADILQKKLFKNKFLLGGKLFKIPCLAQTLSLMVQDGFNVIRGVIDKIRDSIHFWTDSQEREEEFKKATRDVGLSTAVALVLDNDLNWGSTFLMMQQSISLKVVFVHLKNQESKYNSLPTEDEWDLVSQVCQRLEEFYILMKAFERPPASCIYYMYICTTKLSLSDWRSSETMEIKEMALRMSEKFDKYWHAAHDFLAVAAVFHPSFQFFNLGNLKPKLYGDEAESKLARIRKICYELYYEYKSSMPLDPVDDDEEKSSNKSRDFFNTYLRKKKRKLSEKFCSVDYENVFLLGVPVLSPTRSRLNPTMVETLMCTQSWVKNRRRYESRKTEPSTLTSKHSLGTIYDDANAEQGIF